MGAPMARHLAGAGHEVRAWNRTREKAEGLGATVAESPAEAVEGADVVVTMLADGPTVARVMDGITLARRPDLVAGEHGRHRLDRQARRPASSTARCWAPASRPRTASSPCSPAARAATSSPLFEPVSAKVVDLGDEIGTGTRMKLVLNTWVLALVEGSRRRSRSPKDWRSTRRSSWRSSAAG